MESLYFKKGAFFDALIRLGNWDQHVGMCIHLQFNLVDKSKKQDLANRDLKQNNTLLMANLKKIPSSKVQDVWENW